MFHCISTLLTTQSFPTPHCLQSWQLKVRELDKIDHDNNPKTYKNNNTNDFFNKNNYTTYNNNNINYNNYNNDNNNDNKFLPYRNKNIEID